MAACLHQAILDVLPQRQDYYEEWLRPDGLHEGKIGLGPITAVISFLRTEREYDRVMARAGHLAAEWTVDSLPSMRRKVTQALPRWLRVRAAARISAEIVRDVLSTSAASTRVRRKQIQLDVTDSLFCSVRDRQAVPLCAFYAAVTSGVLERLGLPGHARIDRCRAIEGGTCRIVTDVSAAAPAADPAKAA